MSHDRATDRVVLRMRWGDHCRGDPQHMHVSLISVALSHRCEEMLHICIELLVDESETSRKFRSTLFLLKYNFRNDSQLRKTQCHAQNPPALY
jgi:hypothetical protein